MTPVVEIRAGAIGRGADLTLTGVELAIAPGERIALVGGNGSGKTSLLRVLAGLDGVRAGAVRWSGGPLPRGGPRVAAVGVLLQGEPPSRLDVATLVALGLALDAPPAGRARARVAAALLTHQLGAIAQRSCATLSGGEAQRARLARATVADPRLLLLDEPTTHLDPAARAALIARLDALHGATAIVLATHDLDLAATCDRIALLAGGAVIAVGPPATVLTPPLLARALGVATRRVVDPLGGPPLLRVVGPCRAGAVA